MACPTCDHTMQRLNPVNEEFSIFHCPRCGTAKTESSAGVEYPVTVYQPDLVNRVVEFCGTLDEDNEDVINNLIRLGVTEACTHPDVQ